MPADENRDQKPSLGSGALSSSHNDNCNFRSGTVDEQNGSRPNANSASVGSLGGSCPCHRPRTRSVTGVKRQRDSSSRGTGQLEATANDSFDLVCCQPCGGGPPKEETPRTGPPATRSRTRSDTAASKTSGETPSDYGVEDENSLDASGAAPMVPRRTLPRRRCRVTNDNQSTGTKTSGESPGDYAHLTRGGDTEGHKRPHSSYKAGINIALVQKETAPSIEIVKHMQTNSFENYEWESGMYARALMEMVDSGEIVQNGNSYMLSDDEEVCIAC